MKEDLTKLRHARSAKDFPGIDLEEDEYVEVAMRRSGKGLILIWAAEALGFVVLTAILILVMNGGGGSGLPGLTEAAKNYLYLVIFGLCGVLLVTGTAGTFIYKDNFLIVTNKRALRRARNNLLASSMNIIELQSVEDVSFHKSGMFDYVFGVGTVRMATVGDETTYILSYVDEPHGEIKTISKLLQKVKAKGTEN